MKRYLQLKKKLDSYLALLEIKRNQAQSKMSSAPASTFNKSTSKYPKQAIVQSVKEKSNPTQKTFVLLFKQDEIREQLEEAGWSQLPVLEKQLAKLILTANDSCDSSKLRQHQLYNHIRGTNVLTNQMRFMMLLQKSRGQWMRKEFPYARFRIVAAQDMQQFRSEARVTQVLTIVKFHNKMYSKIKVEERNPIELLDIIIKKNKFTGQSTYAPTNIPLLFSTLVFALCHMGFLKDSKLRQSRQAVINKLVNFHRYLLYGYSQDRDQYQDIDNALDFDEQSFKFRYRSKLQRPSLELITLLKEINSLLLRKGVYLDSEGVKGTWRKVGSSAKQCGQQSKPVQYLGFKLDIQQFYCFDSPQLLAQFRNKSFALCKLVLIKQVKPLVAYSLRYLYFQSNRVYYRFDRLSACFTLGEIRKIINQINQICAKCLRLAEDSLVKQSQCFQLLLFRFALDQNKEVWLQKIEQGATYAGCMEQLAFQQCLSLVSESRGGIFWQELCTYQSQ